MRRSDLRNQNLNRRDYSRFAYEMRLVPANKFGVAQKQFEEIGKMVGGWQKWSDSC